MFVYAHIDQTLYLNFCILEMWDLAITQNVWLVSPQIWPFEEAKREKEEEVVPC